jgi:hypothetical protein
MSCLTGLACSSTVPAIWPSYRFCQERYAHTHPHQDVFVRYHHSVLEPKPIGLCGFAPLAMRSVAAHALRTTCICRFAVGCERALNAQAIESAHQLEHSSAVPVWRLWRGRARIAGAGTRSSRQTLGSMALGLRDVRATEAALGVTMLSDKLMRVFDHAVMRHKGTAHVINAAPSGVGRGGAVG